MSSLLTLLNSEQAPHTWAEYITALQPGLWYRFHEEDDDDGTLDGNYQPQDSSGHARHAPTASFQGLRVDSIIPSDPSGYALQLDWTVGIFFDDAFTTSAVGTMAVTTKQGTKTNNFFFNRADDSGMAGGLSLDVHVDGFGIPIAPQHLEFSTRNDTTGLTDHTDEVAFATEYDDGESHLWVVTWNATETKLFFDGDLRATHGPIGAGQVLGNGVWWYSLLGSTGSGNPIIDDIVLWDRALGQHTVEAMQAMWASSATIDAGTLSLTGSGSLDIDIIDAALDLTGSGTLTAAIDSMDMDVFLDLTGSGQLAIDTEETYQVYGFYPALTLLDSGLTQAPTALVVRIEGAPPDTDITFTIDGDPTTAYTATTMSEGSLGPLSIPVPGTTIAGSHTLEADVDDPNSTDPSATFDLDLDPQPDVVMLAADTDPVDVPEAQVSTSVRRWVLQDLKPGGRGTYIFPANPSSADPFPFNRTLTPAHTTAINGQFHISDPIAEVHPWSFKGTSFTEAFIDELRAWAELNYRVYLIDHRNRAWTITIVGTDFPPRRRTADGNDWVHDYTIQTLVYDDEWKVPA